MAKGDIRIEGLADVLKQLDATPAALVAALTPVIEKHTKAMEARALSDVPVASGLLKSSIKSEVEAKPEKGWVFGRVGASAPHAHLVEFGTVSAPAQPFLTPAAESVRAGLESDAKAAIEALK